MPGFSDKLLQEVIRLILSAYYEPQLSPTSHGFRPERGCHTALSEMYHKWIGTKWLVEGDIAQCFDTLDHTVLLSIIGEKIHDGRFLRLIELLLQAGYLEDWRYFATYSGCPQGGILSPLLSNVYLDKLDTFIETTLVPAYSRGERRRVNPPYGALQRQASESRKMEKREEADAPHIPQFGKRLFGDKWLLFLPVLLDCGNGEKEISEEEWNEKSLFLQGQTRT